MFRLRLNARLCISCGVCMDVCQPRAIDMRSNHIVGIEGAVLSFLQLHSDGAPEKSPERMMTFPFLAFPERCDGCLLCVKECPVDALELRDETADRNVIQNIEVGV